MTNATAMNPVIARSPSSLADWMHTKAVRDVTVTSYDMAYGESSSDPEGILAGTVLTQRNLRNRVSWSAIYDNGTFGGLDLGDHASATFYTYDIHGNVDTLVQDYLALFGETDFSRFKKMVYDYDLISGKVNQVAYQRGRPDQFYHRYNYDAENRLTGVQTSHDGWVWENEANYDYYKHGPLARAVIGQQQVQGIDYAYTLQGWIKGVNGTQVGDGAYDMGEDGKTGSVHSKVARDAYGFSLNYYSGSPWSDYHAIGATGNKFASVLAALSTNAKSLYNGNIAAMAVNIRGIGDAKLYNYKYDQLNRIVEMDAYSGLQNNNTWTPVASDDYKERVTYDANGNILTYLRNGATSVDGLAMDSLTYQYGRNSSGQLINNRLRYVHDRVADNAYTEDIDSQTPLTLSQVQAEKLDAQTTDNYQYDEIGNLIKDTKEGITAIEWNVYGKIKSITKSATTITYTYDAAGNRISKVVIPASGPTRKTYYVRDATGNVMSVYEEGGLVNDGNLTQAEVHLYGSSRLGIFKPDVDMTSLVATDVYVFDRGKKFFELSNHLGNVLVSITDRKNGVRLSTDTTLVDYYLPDIASASDYYPFGMTMPGRSSHSDKYRYGFNGKEKDDDLHSLTAYDYGFRIYNPALGKFLSVDPLMKEYPWYTPYQFAGNKVITCVDLDGLEEKWKVTRDYQLDYYPVVDAPGVMQKANNIAGNVLTFAWNISIGAVLETGKTGWNWGVDQFSGNPEPPPNPIHSINMWWEGRRDYFKETPKEQIWADIKDAASDLKNYEAGAQAVISMRLATVKNRNKVTPVANTQPTKSLQVGSYKDMAKVNAKTNLSADHIPSFAAIKQYTEQTLGVQLTKAQVNELRKSSLTMVYETEIHRTISRTYGGRNNRAKIATDAIDLVGAITRDIKALTPSLLKAGYSQGEINAAHRQLTERYLKPKK